MDRVVALYPTPVFAERARGQLVAQGIATDRLDVVSRLNPGRVTHLPKHSETQDFAEYFHVLLTEESEWPLVHEIVGTIQKGKAALVVHPRGKEEIQMVRLIIEAHGPETVFWRVAPKQAEDSLLGNVTGIQSRG
jgi:hypothetical protein